MQKHTCKSGRTYLLENESVGWQKASPCFNGAGFQFLFGTLDDLERLDAKLRWDNISGRYQ